ncbi:MAG: hypothetical protein LBQ83_01760 [Candidatus Margulisbacteria bacterium]|jgi:CRISPR/Cas system-associated exonuclease Cas4 (RecB family)|nr:hypothetical protein [Candidatus Margulisiibacteriota bacterium]
MELTPEQLQEMLGKAVETATAKALEEFKKSIPPEKEKKGKETKDKNEILEKIEEDKKAKAEKTAEYEEIKAATAFNLSLDSFKKDNVKYLPEEVVPSQLCGLNHRIYQPRRTVSGHTFATLFLVSYLK